MFKYEFEKRPPSSRSCASAGAVATDWARSCPGSSINHARRPLPPRPVCHTVPDKTTVPLRVWIIASASCFAVCAALVLATVVITKWGATDGFTTTRELYQSQEQVISQQEITTTPEPPIDSIDDDLPILQKLSIFKNIVHGREHKNLISKPQIHPLHDNDGSLEERNIKKKDKPLVLNHEDISELPLVLPQMRKIEDVPNMAQGRIRDNEVVPNMEHGHIADEGVVPKMVQVKNVSKDLVEGYVPSFKPILPDLDVLPYQFIDARDEYYYNDENLYDDYLQSNSMTNYLIEKVQELHEWVSSDADLKGVHAKHNNDFGSLLKALNESLVEGNVTIVLSKLRDMYYGENYNPNDSGRKILVTNSTDMVSFGILTLDVMLLHNIQLMAWESQDAMRSKMLKDPDVFAFNALFLDPSKVEVTQNELAHNSSLFLKRLNPRQELDDLDIGRNLLENILEVGMSTARAAIHLGRAYKNTKNLITQIQNKEPLTAGSGPNPISKNIDGNTHALNHLQTSFDTDSRHGVASENGTAYTELDCVWLLYCRNLVATTKLNAPYSTMARINGVALRMLTGELAANKALDTMLYEVLAGWTELKCDDMFSRCSKVNAATVVMDSILQAYRKSQQTNNRGR